MNWRQMKVFASKDLKSTYNARMNALEKISSLLPEDVDLGDDVSVVTYESGVTFYCYNEESLNELFLHLPLRGMEKKVRPEYIELTGEYNDLSVRVYLSKSVCKVRQEELPRSEWITTRTVVEDCQPLTRHTKEATS